MRREYERIKREREEETKRKEQAKLEELKQREQEAILRRNPLLNQDLGGDYTLNRKWWEETVFSNQTMNQISEKKEYVNDTVRSAFHRKFMAKVIQ